VNTVLLVSVTLTVWSALTLILTTHGTPKAAMFGCVSGLLCQGLWIVFDLMTGAYGLLPLALVYGTLYVRGYRRWYLAARPAGEG
jgi:hypothetical protein